VIGETERIVLRFAFFSTDIEIHGGICERERPRARIPKSRYFAPTRRLADSLPRKSGRLTLLNSSESSVRAMFCTDVQNCRRKLSLDQLRLFISRVNVTAITPHWHEGGRGRERGSRVNVKLEERIRRTRIIRSTTVYDQGL